MFKKKRSLLSLRRSTRPKSISVPKLPSQSKTLVTSPPLTSTGLEVAKEERKKSYANRISKEPLFYENFITPTEQSQPFKDQFANTLSPHSPEVNEFVDSLESHSNPTPANDDISLLEDDGEDEEFEYGFVLDVGVIYPAGSARLLDLPALSPVATSDLSVSDIDLKPPPRSPYRVQVVSAGSACVSSPSSSIIMPSTPDSTAWPLSDIGCGQILLRPKPEVTNC